MFSWTTSEPQPSFRITWHLWKVYFSKFVTWDNFNCEPHVLMTPPLVSVYYWYFNPSLLTGPTYVLGYVQHWPKSILDNTKVTTLKIRRNFYCAITHVDGRADAQWQKKIQFRKAIKIVELEMIKWRRISWGEWSRCKHYKSRQCSPPHLWLEVVSVASSPLCFVYTRWYDIACLKSFKNRGLTLKMSGPGGH